MKKRDINLQNLQIFSDLSTEEIDIFKDELNIMRSRSDNNSVIVDRLIV